MPSIVHRLRPYCLALVLAIAVQIGWMFAVVMAVSTFDSGAIDGPSPKIYERVQFTDAGETLIVRTTMQSSVQAKVDYFRADDRTDVPAPGAHLPSATFFSSQRSVEYDVERAASLYGGSGGYATSGFDVANLAIPLAVLGRTAYIVIADPAEQRFSIELFWIDTRSRLGFFGKTGFSQAPPASSDQFHASTAARPILDRNQLDDLLRQLGWSYAGEYHPKYIASHKSGLPLNPGQVCVLSDGQVLMIDLVDQTTSRLDPAADVVSAAFVARLKSGDEQAAAPADDGNTMIWIGMRSPGKLVLSHPPTDRRIEMALPAEVTDDVLTLQCLADGSFALQQNERWPGWPRPAPGPTAVRMWHLSAAGDLLHSARYELENNSQRTIFREDVEMNLVTLAGGAPLPVALFHGAFIPFVDESLSREPYGQALLHILRTTWSTCLMALVAAGLSTWLLIHRRRREGLPPSWSWLAFAFLLGLPGYCAYILHRRPVAAPVPVPPRLGIEVFA